MRLIRAPWIVTGDAEPPIRDGVVVIGPDGAIAGVGPAQDQLPLADGLERVGRWGAIAREEHQAVLLPGLVNAHTHLELSALRGGVDRGGGFATWASAMLDRRAHLAPERDTGAIRTAVSELHAFGTAAIGEVTNTLASAPALAGAPLLVRVFHEVFGLRRETAHVMAEMAREAQGELGALPAHVSVALAPHTSFSVHPDTLVEIVGAARSTGRRTSIHLCEHADERAFLADGGGALPGFFRSRGADPADWPPPGLDPIAHLARLGLLGPHLVAVHLTDARPGELRALALSGAHAVLCPRSNRWIEGRLPPLPEILAAGLRPGLGTDSLASNDDLDVLREAAELRAGFPDVPPRLLVAMATSFGAAALDLGTRVGMLGMTLSPGILAVPIEGATPDDPERWLLEDTGRPRHWLADPAASIDGAPGEAPA